MIVSVLGYCLKEKRVQVPREPMVRKYLPYWHLSITKGYQSQGFPQKDNTFALLPSRMKKQSTRLLPSHLQCCYKNLSNLWHLYVLLYTAMIVMFLCGLTVFILFYFLQFLKPSHYNNLQVKVKQRTSTVLSDIVSSENPPLTECYHSTLLISSTNVLESHSSASKKAKIWSELFLTELCEYIITLWQTNWDYSFFSTQSSMYNIANLHLYILLFDHPIHKITKTKITRMVKNIFKFKNIPPKKKYIEWLRLNQITLG